MQADKDQSCLGIMKAFLSAWQDDPKKACELYVTENITIIEPPGLFDKTEFVGRDVPMQIFYEYRDRWRVEDLDAHVWSDEAANMVFSRYLCKWTHLVTGKSVTMHTVEHMYFEDGRIAKMEVLHYDHAGLIATQY